MRLPASCLKFWYGESVRTMMTAPERWPSETILTGIPLVGEIHHQRRQHVGRLDPPGHQRFLDLGPAAVLAVFEFKLRRAGGCGPLLVARATHATGSVRLQVTGRPPTTRAFGLCCVQALWPSGRAAAISPWSTARRERMYGLMAPRSYIQMARNRTAIPSAGGPKAARLRISRSWLWYSPACRDCDKTIDRRRDTSIEC